MDFLNVNLLLVSGKGGVGKTAIASALALSGAASGRRTLLAEYSRQDSQHPFFAVTSSYAPRQISDHLFLARVDARLALKEYVHRNMPLSRLYDRFLDSKTLTHFTDAAPGFDEIMSLGKLYDHVETGGFDLVVFDGPATGHMKTLLRVPAVTTAAVHTGPVHLNALKIQSLLENPARTRVVGVTLAEEMAVREVVELLAFCSDELRLRTAPVIVNKYSRPRFTDQEIQALSRIERPSATLDRMLKVALSHHEFASLQQLYLRQLRCSQPRVLEIPRIVEHPFAAREQAAAIEAALTQQLAQ